MNILERNKTYIMSGPSKPSCTLIWVPGGNTDRLPLSEKASKALDSIREFTDIVLIFSKSSQDLVVPQKMAGTYMAMAYVVAGSDFESSVALYSMEYCQEVIGKWTSYFWLPLEHLGGLEDSDIDSMKNLSLRGLAKSVFKFHRLGCSDLGQIYMLPPKSGLLCRLRYGLDWSDISGMWSTHTSHSRVIYLLPSLIGDILKVMRGEGDSDQYFSPYLFLESFRETGFQVYLSSLIVRLGIKDKILNLEVRDVKF